MNEQLEEAKVTVVIPTFNRCDLITRAITSVLNQTLREWKILVIDDGSTDGTEEVVSDLSCEEPRISYYRMPKNSGQAHALNTALQMVTTKYMVQLDSDDWFENTTLEKLVAGMEKEPETTAMAYGNYTTWTRKKRIIEKVRAFLNKDKFEFISYGPTLCPRFFRTSCLHAVGGWDTHDKYGGRYVEDRRIMYKLIGQYDFLWIDENLYNINRQVDRNIQLTRNVRACNVVKKEAIIFTLKKWGNQYVPKFSYFRGGWLKTKLSPRIQKPKKRILKGKRKRWRKVRNLRRKIKLRKRVNLGRVKLRRRINPQRVTKLRILSKVRKLQRLHQVRKVLRARRSVRRNAKLLT